MKQFLVKQGLCIMIFVLSFFMASFMAPHLMAQNRVPLSKGKIVEVPSISPIVGQGKVFFKKGGKSGTLKAEANGTIPVVDGKSCIFCLDTIKIEPNLKVPLKPFFTESSHQGKSITVSNLSLEGPMVPEDTTALILSGPVGATLRKKGRGFLLVEGEAYLLLNTITPSSAPPEDRDGEWRGSTKCGEFTFVVDPNGKSISRIEFTKLKGPRKTYSLESKSGGWPIADDGKFDIEIIKLLDNITFYGKFNQESTHATGTWEMPSGCSSKWTATKDKLE